MLAHPWVACADKLLYINCVAHGISCESNLIRVILTSSLHGPKSCEILESFTL